MHRRLLPLEIALSEDVLRFLGFQGKVGDRISLTYSSKKKEECGLYYCTGLRDYWD